DWKRAMEGKNGKLGGGRSCQKKKIIIHSKKHFKIDKISSRRQVDATEDKKEQVPRQRRRSGERAAAAVDDCERGRRNQRRLVCAQSGVCGLGECFVAIYGAESRREMSMCDFLVDLKKPPLYLLLPDFSKASDLIVVSVFFFFQAEDGIRDWSVTGVQTCALPI